ncbi:hypothetical protein [Acinetobacter bereziniae]|uniref:hypothetical protein n=1 Tax=Acinetobacter bereziniae TaxID=106648 RepID=UPI00124FD40B|nr:hypothetical protein [Acinetobacter bereziniae]
MDINKEILNEIERFEQCGTHLDVESFISNLKEILGRASPEGFVLMPIKPTEKILQAIFDNKNSTAKAYKAIIKAQEQSHD